MKRIKYLFWLLIRNFYYTKDGEPKRCPKCGSKDFKLIIKDTINYIVSEEDYICKNCGANVGFWAYGYFDPQFRENGAYYLKVLK